MLFSTQKTPKEPTEKLRLRRSVAWYKVNIQNLKALLSRYKQNLHEKKKKQQTNPRAFLKDIKEYFPNRDMYYSPT